MKANSHRSRLALLGLLGILLLVAIGFLFWPQRLGHLPTDNQPVVGATVSIPPAPPPLPSSSKRRSVANSPNALPVQASTQELALLYDERLTFEANLVRLKEFCRSHSSDPNLQKLLDAFVANLLAHAKTELPAVKRALEELDGTAAYKNIMLACLAEADGASSEKADIVWRIALDLHEPAEVRRTASFLTAQLGYDRKRAADLSALLSDPDSQVVVFALEAARQNLDQQNYDLIRTNLIHSTDVHVQVAAVQALGNSTFGDKQSVLVGILNDTATSKNDAFSEPSLVKRAALAYLDIHDPEALQVVKQIALNAQEDPGVRAKAIGRLTPAASPELSNFLSELFSKLDSENSLGMRAIVDVLLADSRPENIEAVRQKVNQVSDPEIRDALLKRVENAAKGENL